MFCSFSIYLFLIYRYIFVFKTQPFLRNNFQKLCLKLTSSRVKRKARCHSFLNIFYHGFWSV